MKIKKTFVAILSLMALTWTIRAQEPADPAVEAKAYDDARVARVKFVDGEAWVQRSYEEGFEEAAINLPIFEKDRLGTTEGRAEVYLGRLNFLRVDYDTEINFERLPELQKTDAALRVLKGGVYLDLASVDYERDIEIQTPDCGVFIIEKGVYRINVNDAGETEVIVQEGLAEVSGTDYERTLRDGQKMVMRNGAVAERPFYFTAAGVDSFDDFNRDRNRESGYSRYSSARYLNRGYEDYEYELTRSGRWVYRDEVSSHIWIPYNLGGDWSPYYNGRWVWTPFYGYVWSSYDSWGYFTHHYGRWHWDAFYGWHWVPGYHWSPGWVYWFHNHDYYGWCPLSHWNRPVVVINNHWHRHHRYWDGVPGHSRGAVVIRKDQLGSARINSVALKRDSLGKMAFKGVGSALIVKPTHNNLKVVDARGKTVFYKEDGFSARNRYSVIKSGSGSDNAAYKYNGDEKSIRAKAYKYSGSAGTSGSVGLSGSRYDRSSSRDVNTENRGVYRKYTPRSGSSYGSGNSGNSSSSGDSGGIRSRAGSSYGKRDSSSGNSSGSSTGKRTTIIKKKDGEPSYSTYYRSGGDNASSPRSADPSSVDGSISHRSYTYKRYQPSDSSSSSYSSPRRTYTGSVGSTYRSGGGYSGGSSSDASSYSGPSIRRSSSGSSYRSSGSSGSSSGSSYRSSGSSSGSSSRGSVSISSHASSGSSSHSSSSSSSGSGSARRKK